MEPAKLEISVKLDNGIFEEKSSIFFSWTAEEYVFKYVISLSLFHLIAWEKKKKLFDLLFFNFQ